MVWKSVKPLWSEELIDRYEELRRYKFPQSFRAFVKKYNSASPHPYIFDTQESEGRVFGSFYSFNISKEGFTIWDSLEASIIKIVEAKESEDFEWYDEMLAIYNRYVCFADTGFGDYIAFDKIDDSIVFIDHETLEVEKIVDSFDELLNCFYDSNEECDSAQDDADADEYEDEYEDECEDEDSDSYIAEEKKRVDIIWLIGELDDLYALTMPNEEEIENAERELGLKFAYEYKKYVRAGGAICGGGIELTGITHFERLNVVSVTMRERRINPLIPDDMYVVEATGIDGMVVLQNESGTIFTTQPNMPPKKLCNSLFEYIESVGRFCPNDNAHTNFACNTCDEFGQDFFQRMENGLVPVFADGVTLQLHHMGLESGVPISKATLLEFESDEYFKPETMSDLFRGFNCSDNYDRVGIIKQRQRHWNMRLKELEQEYEAQN